RAVAESVLQILPPALAGLLWRPDECPSGHSLAQRLSRAHARHPPWSVAASHPQAAPGLVLAALPGASQDQREGVGRRDSRGLDRRCIDGRVEELRQAMGLPGISKSMVSKLCKEIDERLSAFLERPLEGEWP